MTIARARRTLPALIALAFATALAAGAAHAAPDPRLAGSAATRVAVSRTNTELLVASARAVAERLARLVPLAAGARVALQPEGHDPVDTDVSEALLLALNARGFECVVVPSTPGESTTTVIVPDTTGSAAAALAAGASGKDAYVKLQEERRVQQAKADSLAALAAAHPAQAPPVYAAAVGLPLLTYRVAEGRVDYVRLFRSGIFGSERIERRATTRVTLKLHTGGSEAVRWSTSADTTLGDVVNKNELASLEDRMRPETRPTPPQSNLKKVVEPVLVIALVAGLVALFYQNRP